MKLAVLEAVDKSIDYNISLTGLGEILCLLWSPLLSLHTYTCLLEMMWGGVIDHRSVLWRYCFPCAVRYTPYDVAVFAANGAGNMGVQFQAPTSLSKAVSNTMHNQVVVNVSLRNLPLINVCMEKTVFAFTLLSMCV